MSASLPRFVPLGSRPQGPDGILSAVLDDVRTTLRVAWVDSTLRALADEPIFLSAAWAATRPNVTRSFAAGAERLQREAVEAARRTLALDDRTAWLEERYGAAEREHLLRTAQSLHHGAARVYLVVQTWATLARRQTIAGTRREEAPARRGVPSWQEGLVGVPHTVSEEAEALIDVATIALALNATPSSLQAVAAWPHLLEHVVSEVRGAVSSPEWVQSVNGLRRSAAEILRALPHPMALQWDVLERKGLTEERRLVVADYLTAATASMPANTLISAAVWIGVGAPDLPAEF